MKITNIDIKHFRGFPGPSIYSFKLDGKNLLLHGENGSGKSSLYHALDQMFNIDSSAHSFSDMGNLFAKDETGNDITNGFVTVCLNDVPPTSLTWSQSNGRPPNNPLLIDASMRKGFLEYRSLLRTNFSVHENDNLDNRLFLLAVEVLLNRIPVPISGTTSTLGEYWKGVRKPKTHHRKNLSNSIQSIQEFNMAFKAVLPEVVSMASELLECFTGHHMKIDLEFDELVYDKTRREIQNQALHMSIEFNGLPLTNHHTVLNEARLSSLALALFLASILLSNPSPGPGITSPLKLLVMDDVLIGLDLSNRLPLLEILDKYFGDYQVILMTYDLVWYDLAHLRTLNSGRWVYDQLFSDRFGDPGYEIPLHRGNRTYLQISKEHLANHDYRAAAVYARAEFEARLKNFCAQKSLPVIYTKDARQLSSEHLWQAVTGTRGGDTDTVEASPSAFSAKCRIWHSQGKSGD